MVFLKMPPPTGTVTLLFTDIEGSTRLWEERPDAMRVALARHDQLMREAIERHGGFVFKTIGDAFCAAFADPAEGVAAAMGAQASLFAEEWEGVPGIRVRMALHLGDPVCRDNDYFGPTVNRVARILSVGHGGQTILSAAVKELINGRLPLGVTIVEHGSHRLKDLVAPEALFGLLHPDLPQEFPALRSLSTHPNNLPPQLTSFVGRDKEIKEVRELLDGASRLVTLTGPGGTGKTRIALQVAAERIEQYPGGVWWVDLAPIRDSGLVMRSAAAALGITEEAGKTAAQQVTERLGGVKALLILDNFEQVLEAAGEIGDMMAECPQLETLVTSRAVLNLSQEQEYAVPEMPLEDAVTLFVERARSVRAGFSLDTQNRPVVENICRRLDGIPLAVELAAAQARMFPPAHIEKQLSQRFKLLVSPFRNSAQRQRTLGAAIDWSYELLSEEERRVFELLSIFVGGFTLESAESLYESTEVFLFVIHLREQSLLRADEEGGVPRFRMLETLREYGLERLRAAGLHEELAQRHARHFATLAARTREMYKSGQQDEALDLLAADVDNLRVAHDWLLTHSSVEEAGRMAFALAGFWEHRGWIQEGRERLNRCLAVESEIQDRRVHADILLEAGWFAHLLSDYGEADRLCGRSADVSREIGDIAREGDALNNLAVSAYEQGRTEEARHLYERSLQIAREVGDEAKMATRLCNLGLLTAEENRFEEARAHLLEARQLYERRNHLYGKAATLCNLGDLAVRSRQWAESELYSLQGLEIFRHLEDPRGIVATLTNLAAAARRQGDTGGAEDRSREALKYCAEFALPGHVPQLLEILGYTYAEQGFAEQAFYCLAAAATLREQAGTPLKGDDAGEQMALRMRCAADVDESVLRTMEVESADDSLETIVERALRRPDR